jgi:hypothetical protein
MVTFLDAPEIEAALAAEVDGSNVTSGRSSAACCSASALVDATPTTMIPWLSRRGRCSPSATSGLELPGSLQVVGHCSSDIHDGNGVHLSGVSE